MSAPRKFRKRPVVIEAMQWDGTSECATILSKWSDGFLRLDPKDQKDNPGCTAEIFVAANNRWLPIKTGEWIIHDSKGFSPSKPDVFAETYEAVDEWVP